ncbi:putative reverse transcriptase domain-containing protein [Tanacetum coccineum]
MTKLTQKKVKFEWGDKQETTFQLLKQKLCSAPILALPEGSGDCIVYCDASIKGLGAVLMQREKNSPGYDILDFDSSWCLVKCMHKYVVSSLMDMAYRMKARFLEDDGDEIKLRNKQLGQGAWMPNGQMVLFGITNLLCVELE